MSTSSASKGDSMHSNLLREFNKGNVFDKYEVAEVIGEGSIGAVCKVRIKQKKVGGSAFHPKHKGFSFAKLLGKKTKSTNHKLSEHSQDYLYALKSIQLARVTPTFLKELENEIDILRTLDHPNIVRAHEVYVEKNQIYLVMELCDGGDLYARSPYSERQAGVMTERILSAIRYMHERGVVHRDLKFENIMFESTEPDCSIKVIDFGLSKKFVGEPGYMTERVGTIYTMAPQVLQGMYSSQADMWSIGVIAFMLLSASKPFYHKRRRVVIDQIMRGKFSFSAATWENISDDAKDFVKHLLVVHPKQRMTAEQAMKHPWIEQREELSDSMPRKESLARIHDNLSNYRHTSKLKKLALTVIAHRSTQNEIVKLRTIFEKYDTKKDGVLSFEEFEAALKDIEYPEETIGDIFNSIDMNKNGHIMWTEFLAATIEAQGYIAEDRIAEAFDRLDSDDSGYISPQNLREFLGKDCSPEQAEQIIQSADTDKNGKISYPEFLAAFRDQRHKAADKVFSRTSSHPSDTDLLDIDAKIPGGKYGDD